MLWKKEKRCEERCDFMRSLETHGNSDWYASSVDSALIQIAFMAHRIASRDEKTYSFLNMFQLKSQSFVTLGSISPFLFFQLLLRYSSAASLLVLFEAVDPFYFWFLPFVKRREGETWIFLQQLLHHFFSKTLEMLAYHFLFFLAASVSAHLRACMN